MSQVAGQYGVDMFIGSTLQMDAEGNSSTVTLGRLSGFGGAPNMGHNPGGRRHATPAWLSLITSDHPLARGRKLVVQIVETFQRSNEPTFVETLDAVQVGLDAGLPVSPVMIYGDDVTHLVTEEGVAYLYKARDMEERRAAIAAVAGVTPLGQTCSDRVIAGLRRDGLVAYPEDLGIRRTDAKRSLLAARTIEELVDWSGGLYQPPNAMRTWR
jgi:malonate decarboxylase alpha subunit